MHTRFQAIWSDLSPQLQQALTPYLEQDEFPAMFTAEQVNALKTQLQCNDDELALALLPVAAACAVTPISHFNVGAIARGESGHFYLGQIWSLLAPHYNKRYTQSKVRLHMLGYAVSLV